jgi:hypothetical protein
MLCFKRQRFSVSAAARSSKASAPSTQTAPSNSRYCGVLANCKTPTQCAGQALLSNAVSLALDGAGFAAGFLPGGGAVVAIAQIGVGTASTINSAFSASTATATGQRALGGALGSIASIQLAALAPAAQYAGVAAKAVPFLGALVSLGSGLNDAYQTYADYQSCLAGH